MREGLTEDKIAALERYQASDAFTPQEQIALRFAEQMALNHHALDDEFFRQLRTQFTDCTPTHRSVLGSREASWRCNVGFHHEGAPCTGR
jgi:hypothetical protein